MKRYGDSNVIQSEVKSDGFASTQEFNKLIVNDLSEVDQSTLDHDVIIFNKADDHVYTYDTGSDSWISPWNVRYDGPSRVNDHSVIYVDDVKEQYNEYRVSSQSNILVDKELFNFGPAGAPIDFVIDFWLVHDEISVENGTLLYNGLGSGQVDLERNMNLLMTTHGAELVKSPEYQLPPTVVEHPEDDGFLNVLRPRLKSNFKVDQYHLCHVALIRSGDTTYLAIDGIIHDSAPSVRYFYYDDVMIGSEYHGNFDGGIVNLRVSKNTDRGWTTDFTPPNFNPVVDANTDLLLTDGTLTDSTGNYSLTSNGIVDSIQQRFPVMLDDSHNNCVIKTNLTQDLLVLQPPRDVVFNYYFSPSIKFRIIWPTNIRYAADGVKESIYVSDIVSDTNVFCNDRELIYLDHFGGMAFEYTWMRGIVERGLRIAQTDTFGDTTVRQDNMAMIVPTISRHDFTVVGDTDFGDISDHYYEVLDHPQRGFRAALDMRVGDLIYDVGATRFGIDGYLDYGSYRPEWISLQFDIKLLSTIGLIHQLAQFEAPSIPNMSVNILNNALVAPGTFISEKVFDVDKWYRVLVGPSLSYRSTSYIDFGYWLYIVDLHTGETYKSYNINVGYVGSRSYSAHFQRFNSGNYLLGNIIISKSANISGATTSSGTTVIRYPERQLKNQLFYDDFLRTVLNT